MEPQRDELAPAAPSPADQAQRGLMMVLGGGGINLIAFFLSFIPLIGIVAMPLALGGGGMAAAGMLRDHRRPKVGGETSLACLLLGVGVLCVSLLNVMFALSSVLMGLMMALMALMLGAGGGV